MNHNIGIFFTEAEWEIIIDILSKKAWSLFQYHEDEKAEMVRDLYEAIRKELNGGRY